MKQDQSKDNKIMHLKLQTQEYVNNIVNWYFFGFKVSRYFAKLLIAHTIWSNFL